MNSQATSSQHGDAFHPLPGNHPQHLQARPLCCCPVRDDVAPWRWWPYGKCPSWQGHVHAWHQVRQMRGPWLPTFECNKGWAKKLAKTNVFGMSFLESWWSWSWRIIFCLGFKHIHGHFCSFWGPGWLNFRMRWSTNSSTLSTISKDSKSYNTISLRRLNSWFSITRKLWHNLKAYLFLPAWGHRSYEITPNLKKNWWINPFQTFENGHHHMWLCKKTSQQSTSIMQKL